MTGKGLIRAYDSELQLLHRIADAAIIIGCLALSVWLRGLTWDDKYTIAAISAVALFYLYAKMTNLYQSYRIGGIAKEIPPVLTTWAGTVASAAFLAFAFKIGHEYSRLAIVAAAVTTPLVLILWRFSIRSALMWLRALGYNTRSVAIIGTNDTAKALAENIEVRPWTGLKLLGLVESNDTADPGKRQTADHDSKPTLRMLGNLDDLYRMARNNDVDIVYIAIPLSMRDKLNEVLAKLGDTTVSLYLVPDIYTASMMQGHWVTVGSVPTISVIDDPLQGVGSWIKRVEDIVVSLLVLTVMAIPMLLIAIGIKLTSKGPVLYVQKRYGVNCEPIDVYKFRTMTVTENDDEFTQARPGDPRVTRFGAFLRRTSLDELPQFFNVLGGAMSVVGPRPHAVAHNEEFRGRVNAYTMRHKIKPGVTGLAQVNGLRGSTPCDADMEARVRRDIEYINGWSIWLDMRIMLATPLALFRGENAH